MAIEYGVNYIAVIVASIVAFLIGWLWHGPLFGKAWIKEKGFTQKDIDKAKKKGMTKNFVFGFLVELVMAWVLAVVLLSFGVTAMGIALMLVFLIWLGFVAMVMGSYVVWEGTSMKLFWIGSLHWLVVMIAMAIVISLF